MNLNHVISFVLLLVIALIIWFSFGLIPAITFEAGVVFGGILAYIALEKPFTFPKETSKQGGENKK